jgi:hypothetical protein
MSHVQETPDNQFVDSSGTAGSAHLAGGVRGTDVEPREPPGRAGDVVGRRPLQGVIAFLRCTATLTRPIAPATMPVMKMVKIVIVTDSAVMLCPVCYGLAAAAPAGGLASENDLAQARTACQSPS